MCSLERYSKWNLNGIEALSLFSRLLRIETKFNMVNMRNVSTHCSIVSTFNIIYLRCGKSVDGPKHTRKASGPPSVQRVLCACSFSSSALASLLPRKNALVRRPNHAYQRETLGERDRGAPPKNAPYGQPVSRLSNEMKEKRACSTLTEALRNPNIKRKNAGRDGLRLKNLPTCLRHIVQSFERRAGRVPL